MGGIERGERNLTLTSLEKLAGKLGVDALELLARSTDTGIATESR